jgi:uncharacterized integral membrane protein
MGSYFKAVLLLIVLVALVTFGIKNLEPVTLHYYLSLHSMPIPVYGIVYGSILVGIFIGMLVGIGTRLGQRQQIKQLQKENRSLKNQVKTPEAEETPVAEETSAMENETSPDETQALETGEEAKEEEKEPDF